LARGPSLLPFFWHAIESISFCIPFQSKSGHETRAHRQNKWDALASRAFRRWGYFIYAKTSNQEHLILLLLAKKGELLFGQTVAGESLSPSGRESSSRENATRGPGKAASTRSARCVCVCVRACERVRVSGRERERERTDLSRVFVHRRASNKMSGSGGGLCPPPASLPPP
jgi:hypothetical protein